MLTKLLKYDLKWIYKAPIVFYILSIIFAILSRLTSLVENSLLFSIISSICSGVMIGMLVSSLINALMRSWARLVRNFYQDESYLTHTLPIQRKTLYLSKVISGLTTIFTTVLIAILSLFIAYYSKENLDILKNTLNLAATTYNTTVINLLLIISLVFFLEVSFMLLCGYTGIIKGHQKNHNKIVKSIIYGLIYYFTFQILTLLIIFLIGLINPSVMNIINTTQMINFQAMKIIMYAGIIIYIIYNTFFYLLSNYFLKQGINVD